MSDELIVLTLTPAPCDVPVDIRLRQLLKTAGRRDRLRCVSVGVGPEAWSGWIRTAGEKWTRVCAGMSPVVVLSLLAERPAEEGEIRMVLPTGVKP